MHAVTGSSTAPEPAHILARLIHHGLAAQLPESLPPEWQAAYHAVRSLPASTFAQRERAFLDSIADRPDAAHMELEVQQAADELAHDYIGQLRVYSAWETLEAPPPAQPALVQGVIARPSLNLLVGAPGAKKTWLALHLAVSVATGQPWLGRSTQPAPVLIVDEEGGLQRTWSRLALVIRGLNAPRTAPLHFIPPPFHNFAEDNVVVPLVQRAHSLNAGLIVIDCLNNIMPGTDENNVLSVQPVLANLRRLSLQADVAVLVIHHTNKQGVFRGSSALASGVDHMLLVQSPPQDSRIQLSTIKARDIEPLSLAAQASFTPDAFTLSLAEYQAPSAKLSNSARAVLLTLAELGEAATPQLIPQRGASRARTLVYELASAGYITRTNPGSHGTPALYALTPLGHEAVNHA